MIVQSASMLAQPVVYTGHRVVAPLGAETEDLDLYRMRFGSPQFDAASFRTAVSDSELTGRGGAHIPAAWKLSAAYEAGAGGTVVINGAEGEPGSAKDASLLQLRPHLVLEGAIAVVDAIRAAELVVWVHESSSVTRRCIADAIRERRADLDARGLTVRMLLAPEGYVGGESSAVIRALRGGPALPQHSRDRARPWGEGPAILVHNAETHARLGLLALGADPVATSLVTVVESSAPLEFQRRTVIEADRSSTIGAVVAEAGAPAPAAVLIGGCGGTWVAWNDAEGLPLDPTALRDLGYSLGAGVLHLLPRGRDGMVETVGILDWLASESARQCGPCIFGLPALSDAVRATAAGRRGDGVDRVASLIAGRGACRHPDGALRMAMSAMEVFGP